MLAGDLPPFDAEFPAKVEDLAAVSILNDVLAKLGKQ